MGNFAGKEENYLTELDADLDGNPMPLSSGAPAQARQTDGSGSDFIVGGGGSDSMDVERSAEGAEEGGGDDTVPTVFRWEHGGRQVYITGTFNNWERQIPMHRSGNDFTYIHDLRRGKHAYKFVVDDEWRFAPDQPTVADIEGRINNFIDVHNFKSLEDADDEQQARGAAAAEEEEVYGQFVPDSDEYTKEPPPLPPHLRHIILNKPLQTDDALALPVPQHVALDHLYCTAIKDGIMVLGITQRYKQKFTTVVFFSPT